MLAAATRVGRRGDPVSRTLSNALSRAALGRFSPDERTWLNRVDHRGRNVLSMHSSVPPLWGRCLFALVRGLAPRNAIELGTSWGVSGAYQGAALELNDAGRLTTFEGNSEWAAHARRLFGIVGIGRIDQRVGWLDDALEPALAQLGMVDYAYIDADHGEEPNRRYFEAMLPHLNAGAVLVFDDIRLSAEMRRTWSFLREHDRVAGWAAVHRMGILVMSARDGEEATARP